VSPQTDTNTYERTKEELRNEEEEEEKKILFPTLFSFGLLLLFLFLFKAVVLAIFFSFSHWLFISSVERVDSIDQELTTSIIGDGWRRRKSRDSRGTSIPKTHLFILYILLKSHGIVSTRFFRKQLFLSLSLPNTTYINNKHIMFGKEKGDINLYSHLWLTLPIDFFFSQETKKIKKIKIFSSGSLIEKKRLNNK
jgi:hypothetical protein